MKGFEITLVGFEGRRATYDLVKWVVAEDELDALRIASCAGWDVGTISELEFIPDAAALDA